MKEHDTPIKQRQAEGVLQAWLDQVSVFMRLQLERVGKVWMVSVHKADIDQQFLEWESWGRRWENLRVCEP